MPKAHFFSRFFRPLTIFLCLVLLFSVFAGTFFSAFADPDTEDEDLENPIESSVPGGQPRVDAEAFLLIDAYTGNILATENADQIIDPGPLAMIVTVALAAQAVLAGQISLTDSIVVTPEVLASVPSDAPTINLVIGEEVPLEMLLHAIMLRGAADAAAVLAHRLGGSVSGFVHMMNDWLQPTNAQNTVFTSEHGYWPGATSTASDLMIITQEAMRLEYFLELYALPNRFFPSTGHRSAGRMVTTNGLANPDSPHYFNGASGILAGSLDQNTGFHLITQTEQGELSFLAVVLGAPVGETQFAPAYALLDWATNSLQIQTVIDVTRIVDYMEIEMGVEDSVAVRPMQRIEALLPTTFNLDNATLDVRLFSIDSGEIHRAPINQGTVVGELIITYGERTFDPIPLVAANTVALSRAQYLRAEVEATLSNPWVIVVILGVVAFFLAYMVYAISHAVSRRRARKHARATGQRGTVYPTATIPTVQRVQEAPKPEMPEKIETPSAENEDVEPAEETENDDA